MYATERQRHIEGLIATDGRVSVVDLAERFEVTTETVRRDLDALDAAGIVRRVHGGAVSRLRVSTAESSIAERASQHQDAKAAIAASALNALGPNFTGSLYVDAGSSTAALATLLAHATPATTPLEIVTHSMTIGHILAGSPLVNLTAIGGRVRGLTAASVGADTVRTITNLRPDVAFVGTNGISASFGLSTPDPDEAAVKRAIITSSQRVIALADAEKFDAELMVSFAQLDQLDLLVTNKAPQADLARALENADVEVWVA